jgi:hypothetical protein
MNISRVLILSWLIVLHCGAIASPAGDVLNSGTPIAVSFGRVPVTMDAFKSTDCDLNEPKFHDCSAKDTYGREYVFFDGGLTKVSASIKSSSPVLRLPAGLRFGEKIELSLRKITKKFMVNLSGPTVRDRQRWYSSGFVFTSADREKYALELGADEEGRLVYVAGRLNSP